MSTTTIKSSFKENFNSKIISNDFEIVGYTIDGKPLSEKAYNKKLEKAETDYKNGSIISSIELRKKYNLI